MTAVTDFKKDEKYTARIKSTKRLTPLDTEEIKELVVEVNDPDFSCEIDQSFGVLVNKSDDFGNSVHHRLYSVADIPLSKNGKTTITMLVKRCSYIDDFSGERHQGLASNYLCDRKAGDQIMITGPHALPFVVPKDKKANMLLIGIGTGIAPFRAFVKHIYRDIGNWEGKVRLFHGTESGLELLYKNDKEDDKFNYYDQETFGAFSALSTMPNWSDPIALDTAIEERAAEILGMLSFSNTYIYVAGYEKIRHMLDKAFIKILGSKEKWETRKAELIAGKKWAEIIY